MIGRYGGAVRHRAITEWPERLLAASPAADFEFRTIYEFSSLVLALLYNFEPYTVLIGHRTAPADGSESRRGVQNGSTPGFVRSFHL